MGVSLPPFSTFLEAHREEVYRVLAASVGSHDAQDCFQETFLAALRAYPRLHPGSNLRAWVLTDRAPEGARRPPERGRLPVPVANMVELPNGQTPPGEPDEPDVELWAAVRALPPSQRAAVVHRFVADLSYTQIAQVLDCSEEAARQRVHAGLTTLRKVYQG
jgi:DNA-directed RNA polymerase specialized sigma24 family protein